MEAAMWSLYILFLLQAFTYTESSDVYTFGDCSKPMNNVFKTYGARVKSQLSRYYKGENMTCTFIFKAARRDMTFHMILLNVDIPTDGVGCVDSLTIRAHNQERSNSTVVLEKFCGKQTNEELITQGHYLEVTWVGSQVTQGHMGFSLVITAVKSAPGTCNESKFFECEQGYCIHSSLFCDGTYNCPDRKDEVGCVTTAKLVRNPGIGKRNVRVTTEEPKYYDDDDDWEEGMDTVSIMIIVGVILLIVFGCFLVGCRKREAAENLVQRTLLRRWSDNRGRHDPNYRGGDGRPATPPPSYSFIERQASYLSDISITSSQLSFPPEYDEAVDMPDNANNSTQQPRRMRFLSRHSSSRRGQRPLVQRVGTFSPGDINARRGSRLQRSMSDGERPHPRLTLEHRRHHPQRTSSGVSHDRQGGNVPVPVPPLRFRIESTESSIFEDVFEDTMSHLTPSAIIEEDDIFFANRSNNNAATRSDNVPSNELPIASSSRDHHADDSDTALLDDEESDHSSTDNGAPSH